MDLDKVKKNRLAEEQGMWAILRRNFVRRAAAASSCGLWKVPHVSQCGNWDCGVACVQMVLRGLGREGERSSLLAALGTRSVWTIDLAMLLHRFGVRFMYCTRTTDATEAYSAIDFYRNNFDRDAPRVQALFKEAELANVGAVQKAFSWQELAMLLSGYEYSAIVLVDARYLYRPPPSSPSSGSTQAATATTPVLVAPSPPMPPSAASTEAQSLAACPRTSGECAGGRCLGTPKRPRDEHDADDYDDYLDGEASAGGVRCSGTCRGEADKRKKSRDNEEEASWRRTPHRQHRQRRQRRQRRRRPHGDDGERRSRGAEAAIGASAPRPTSPAVPAPAEAPRSSLATSTPLPTTAPPSASTPFTFLTLDNVPAPAPLPSPTLLSSPSLSSSISLWSGSESESDAGADLRPHAAAPAAASAMAAHHLRVWPAPSETDRAAPGASPLVHAVPLNGRIWRKTLSSGALSGHAGAVEDWDEREGGQVRHQELALSLASRSLSYPSLVSAGDGYRGGGGGALGARARSIAPAAAPPPPCAAAPPPLAAATSPDSAYCGHYINLVGWSEADGVFIARDPALPSCSSGSALSGDGSSGSCSSPANADADGHVCIALTPEVLDRARRSYGTDEDILIIDLARSRRAGVTAAPLAAAAAATALAASAATSAAAASAMVGIFAMAAAAAAARGDASSFKEWAWPDPVAWFGGAGAVEPGGEEVACSDDDEDDAPAGGSGDGESCATAASASFRVRLTPAGAEAAARKLAKMLTPTPSGWRFPSAGDSGSRVPRSWGSSSSSGAGGEGGGDRTGADGSRAEAEEGERWAARVASAMEGLRQGGRRAAYTVEVFLQGGATRMEGLLEGGRRAAYTVEGLLEGGRRAAYSLRDSLADVADAPGGAGAECCSAAVRESPASPLPRAVCAR